MRLNSVSMINTLLEKQLIGDGTLVTGKVKTIGLGHMPQYINLELMILAKKGDNFICRDRLNKRYTIEFNRIETLDGMELARFAGVYNIKADGTVKGEGKKRGRKPKSAQINMSEETNYGTDKRTKDHYQAQPACA